MTTRTQQEAQMGEAIADCAEALSRFGHAYQRLFEAHLSDDAIIGGEGFLLVIQGLRTMLNASGDSSSMDRGQIDAYLIDIALSAGYSDEEI